MFGFLRRSAPRPVSDAIARALATDGQAPSASDRSRLRMVESRGQYSDRKVTYFRIFDPTIAAQRSLDIQRYRDLDAFGSLVLRAGHVERDGKVVLTRPVVVRAAGGSNRAQADRTKHADDAHIVRGETGASSSTRIPQVSPSEHAL